MTDPFDSFVLWLVVIGISGIVGYGLITYGFS